MGVGLAILYVLLLITGMFAVSYGLTRPNPDSEGPVLIGLFGMILCILLGVLAGTYIGHPHNNYNWGCKQAPSIVVNSTEYRCTP